MLRFVLSVKAFVLFGLIVALPLLALPVAARLIDARLSGAPPAELAAGANFTGSPEVIALPMIVERFATTAAADPVDLGASSSAGLDDASAPPLAPATAFGPLLTPAAAPQTADEEVPIDEQTVAQLQKVRTRLEELGADYVIVETTDAGGQFRFHCRMLVDANSPFTRPFEAISPDPVAAGQQVLREVEAWRLAAIDKTSRAE
jgi:hypothetical protein